MALHMYDRALVDIRSPTLISSLPGNFASADEIKLIIYQDEAIFGSKVRDIYTFVAAGKRSAFAVMASKIQSVLSLWSDCDGIARIEVYKEETSSSPEQIIVDSGDDDDYKATIDGKTMFLNDMSRSQLITLAKFHIDRLNEAEAVSHTLAGVMRAYCKGA